MLFITWLVLLVCIGFVLGNKGEFGWYLAEQHLGDGDPVFARGRGHESFEIVAAKVTRRPFVDSLWESLEQSHRNVSMQKGEPLEQEATRLLHALGV